MTWSSLTDSASYFGTTTPILTVNTPDSTQSGDQFRCVASIGFPPDATSAAVTLTVLPQPANDDFANAFTLTGSSLQTTGTNAGAVRQPGEPLLPPNSAATFGHSVWWTWTAPNDGVVTVDTLGSNFATTLGVYTGNTVSTLTKVGTNYNGGANSTSQLVFQASGGTTYQIAVDGVGGATGNIVLDLALSTAFAPTILTQPAASLTAPDGGNVIMSVAVVGYPWPYFQWQRLAAGTSAWTNLTDGGSFNGTTTPTLGITGVGLSMSGDQYRCQLGDGLATLLVSSAETLNVSVGYVFSTQAGSAGQNGGNDGRGTNASFQFPSRVAVDAAGNLYCADEYIIRKILPDGTVTTIAGAVGQAGSNDGVGTAARFNAAQGVALDPAGNLYIADSLNSVIRKILPDGTVTTIAGTAGLTGSTDGIGAAASFYYPTSVAADTAGNLYVADINNSTIRKISQNGTVSTLAGTAGQIGNTNAIGAAARFNYPEDLAVDGTGNVYVADTNNGCIRKILPNGTVSTLASGLSYPNGIAVDSAGNILVADTFNRLIRRISPSGTVFTIGGQQGVTGSTDGAGTAATFNHPNGVAVDAAGNVYVADTYNYTVRKGTPSDVAVAFATQPSSQNVTTGQNATFTAVLAGVPAPSGQWQRLPSGSSTWVNLSEGTPYSGTATATLTVGPVNVGQSGDQFRCVATNGFPPDATSNAATLTVTPPAFAAWAAGLGLSGASAAADAVPFTDGAPNLVRYAMNLGATPAAGQLPVLTSVMENGVLYLKLQYRQRKGLTAVTLTPEWAPDLLSWSAVAPADLAQLPDDDADTARFEARAAVPPSGRVFLHLRATLTP